MEKADQFLETYQQFLQIELPYGIREEYTVKACIYEREKSACYLIQNKMTLDGYLLKIKECEEDQRTLSLEKERLTQLSQLFPEDYEEPVYFWEKGKEYLIRRYIKGMNLEEYRERNPLLTVREILELSIRICDIVARLHSQDPPMIHRDIKPQNLIIDYHGRMHLIDFETTRTYREGQEKDTHFWGTEQTAAPEQYGYAQTDVRTDVYAIGKVIAFLYYGEYDAENSSADRLERLHCQSGEEKKIRRVIDKATSFSPKDRYSDVFLLRKCLQNTMRALDTGAAYRRIRLIGALEAVAAVFLLSTALFLFYIIPAREKDKMLPEGLVKEAVLVSLEKESLSDGDFGRITRIAVIGNRVYDSDVTTRELENMVRNHEFNSEMTDGTIQDISMLAQMEHLTEVFLCGQNISDISALKGLPIERLYLCGNQIRDFTVIETLDNLQVLYIVDNPVETMPDLSKCPNLATVNFSGNELENIDFLAGSAVKKLMMTQIHVADGDYGVLMEMRDLKTVFYEGREQGFYDVLPHLTNLEEIGLWEYPYKDLQKLKTLQNLKSLTLAGSRLQSLEGIEDFMHLQNLYCDYTSITDISIIRNFKELGDLQIQGLLIDDYTPILDCPNLRWLGVDEKQKEIILEMDPEHLYEIETE